MPTGLGYASVLGVGAESVYGTAVAATQQIRDLEFSIDDEYELLPDDSLVGNLAYATPDLGMLNVRGAWRCSLTYTLQHALLKHFFGSLVSGRYSFLTTLEGTSLTAAIDKQVSIWEHPGIKINQLVMQSGPGPATMNGTMIARRAVRSGTVNTSASLAALSNVDGRLLHTDLTVRLGVATAALTVTEDIGVIQQTVTLARPMAEQHTNQQREVLEPIEDNWLDATLALTLARYTTNQYKTWQAANTRLACRLYFTNGVRTQEWLVPNLVITAAPNPVSGPGIIPQTIVARIAVGQDTLTATTISAVASGNHYLDSANSFPFSYPGATVRVSGFATAANNGLATILTYAPGDITVSGPTLVNEAATPSVTITRRQPLVRVVES